MMAGGDDPHSRFAGEQAASYKRGFVLGLTMAETILLLTFVVLMLLVVGFERREREAEVAKLEARRFAVLIESMGLQNHSVEDQARVLAAVAEIARAGIAANAEWNDDFTELVKGVLTQATQDPTLIDLASALRADQIAVREMQARLADALGDPGAGEALEKLLAQSESDRAELAKLKGKNRDLTDQVKRLGGVLPSCWVEDGRPVFVFDVIVGSEGIRLRDRTPERFLSERNRLLGNETIDPAYAYAQAEFLRVTRPMFADSVSQDCRYYVVIYDGTAAEEKDLYKAQLQTVEGHFYKRQSNEPPPF